MSDSTFWPCTPIGELVEFFDYKRVPLSRRDRLLRQGPYPYYGASGVIDHIDDYIFEGRYLLIAEDGENLNSRKTPIAFFADGKFWVNNHAHIIRCLDGQADDYFLKAWFDQANISGYITGAAQPKLSQANLKRIELRVPDLLIQKRIASILSAYDDLIENNLRRIRILEEMAQALYREWFVKFRLPGHERLRMVESSLGKIPEGWFVSAVEDAFEILGGGTPSKKVEDYWKGGDIVWFVPSDLTAADAMFMEDSGTAITDQGLRRSSAKLFPAFCVMLTSRATIGLVSINTVPACTNQGFITCVPNYEIPLYFLYFWLLDSTELFIRFASGATFKEISKTVFKTIELVIPAEAIVRKFESTLRPIAEQLLNLQRKNNILRQTRDLLLPRLISGELDVSDLHIDVGEEAA